MTDFKRLNHLFVLLMRMSKEKKGDVWEEFRALYNPTPQEEEKLRLLYQSYSEG